MDRLRTDLSNEPPHDPHLSAWPLALAMVCLAGAACGGEPAGGGAGGTTSPPIQTTGDPSATNAAQTADGARDEPVRLPYPDFGSGDRSGQSYTYSHALTNVCSVVYQRWWGMPPTPGGPMEVRAVRSAMFGGAGGPTPISMTTEGEQRVFRRTRDYQANLTFAGCTDAEVDAVLRITEVDPMPSVGSALPAAADVCLGTQGAMTRHTATPSRAGVYDPDAPVWGEHLNWMVPGAGCVTYPALSARARCDGESLPWVATTLCQQ